MRTLRLRQAESPTAQSSHMPEGTSMLPPVVFGTPMFSLPLCSLWKWTTASETSPGVSSVHPSKANTTRPIHVQKGPLSGCVCDSPPPSLSNTLFQAPVRTLPVTPAFSPAQGSSRSGNNPLLSGTARESDSQGTPCKLLASAEG